MMNIAIGLSVFFFGAGLTSLSLFKKKDAEQTFYTIVLFACSGWLAALSF